MIQYKARNLEELNSVIKWCSENLARPPAGFEPLLLSLEKSALYCYYELAYKWAVYRNNKNLDFYIIFFNDADALRYKFSLGGINNI